MSSTSNPASPTPGALPQKPSCLSLVRQVQSKYSAAVHTLSKSTEDSNIVITAEGKTQTQNTKSTTRGKDSTAAVDRPVNNLEALRRLSIVNEKEAGFTEAELMEVRKKHFARDLRKQCKQKRANPDPEVFMDENGNEMGW